jgi:biotin synthase-like enzyme
MIGLPFQTVEDLAADVRFFEEMDVDMIGMGPFVYHADTPLAADTDNSPEAQNARLELALKMIAVTRLYLKDVNIASTTALQALAPMGRERGVKAGANIIMPNITPRKYREDYLLYQGKPCTERSRGLSRVSCKTDRDDRGNRRVQRMGRFEAFREKKMNGGVFRAEDWRAYLKERTPGLVDKSSFVKYYECEGELINETQIYRLIGFR